MGVTAQILEHMLGAAEGWFGVDNPVLSEQGPQPGSEDLRLREQRQIPGKMKLAMLKGRLETGHKLTAKKATQHRNGKKEVSAGSDPVGVIERESAGGDDTVDMGMKPELLVPGMEHAEEPDFGAEMSGVTSNFQKGFCTGTEQ